MAAKHGNIEFLETYTIDQPGNVVLPSRFIHRVQPGNVVFPKTSAIEMHPPLPTLVTPCVQKHPRSRRIHRYQLGRVVFPETSMIHLDSSVAANLVSSCF